MIFWGKGKVVYSTQHRRNLQLPMLLYSWRAQRNKPQMLKYFSQKPILIYRKKNEGNKPHSFFSSNNLHSKIWGLDSNIFSCQLMQLFQACLLTHFPSLSLSKILFILKAKAPYTVANFLILYFWHLAWFNHNSLCQNGVHSLIPPKQANTESQQSEVA